MSRHNQPLRRAMRTAALAAGIGLTSLLMAPPAGAQGLPPPLLPNQQDGVYIDSGGLIIDRTTTNTSVEFFDVLDAIPMPAGFTAATVLLPEQGNTTCTATSTSLGTCSDAITLRTDPVNTNEVDAYFLSTGATAAQNTAFFDTRVRNNIIIGPAETGQWQDLSSDFHVASETVWVQSAITIPEPAALTLLGMGLAGLLAVRRKST